MKDIQSQPDDRNMPIDQVGVKDIRFPVRVQDKRNGTQHTVATVNMYVTLPHNFRGTHMSRFLEILNCYEEITPSHIPAILEEMKSKLNAETAYFDIEFPYFIMKSAPVSNAKSVMEYICSIHGDSSAEFYFLKVKVPVMSLCPCSKEISRFGAHNQRSIIEISIKTRKKIWFEELITIAESSASSEIYSLLKREDEKYVTENSYNNPAFVEDIVRAIAVKLKAHELIDGFSVESENMESIHNHSAYAKIVYNIL
ncbi:MAG: GTP cyclohydrolase I FolE2 [Spirochaetes bacterium]|nr:GTP cyclohydrolase I FolE2 [Spirochaetota bacterium]MBN2770956.1 GTP cyclohydrolase I FolE2 [Spirochaetota bacterium]